MRAMAPTALMLLLPAFLAAGVVAHSAAGSSSAFQSAPSSAFTQRLGQAGSLCQAPALRAPTAPRGATGGSLTIVSQFRGGGRGRGGGGGRGRGRGRGPPIMEKARGPPMNEEIQFPEVRVVLANPDGKDDMLGIMPRDEAIRRAEDEGMDLILVSPEATPPVCKITSYDKMRYEEEKKAKAMKRGSKNAELKEVKLSYKIDTHDYEVRKRAAIKFLTKGDKVKASIRFKGREMAHRELAKSTMQKLLADCVDLAVCEKMPVVDGRMMQMIMAPTVEVMKASDLKKKQREKAKSKVAKKGEVVVSSDEEEESEDEDDLDALNAEISDDDEDDEEEESLIDYDIDMMGSEEVTAKIAEVGERVRALKENGASKEKVGAHVDELLALKARYVELTGETWAPAS